MMLDLAANEARPTVRIIAAALAICSWAAVGLFGFVLYEYGSWGGDTIPVTIGALFLAVFATFVAFRGFVPPWFLKLIPFAGSAVSNKQLREK